MSWKFIAVVVLILFVHFFLSLSLSLKLVFFPLVYFLLGISSVILFRAIDVYEFCFCFSLMCIYVSSVILVVCVLLQELHTRKTVAREKKNKQQTKLFLAFCCHKWIFSQLCKLPFARSLYSFFFCLPLVIQLLPFVSFRNHGIAFINIFTQPFNI